MTTTQIRLEPRYPVLDFLVAVLSLGLLIAVVTYSILYYNQITSILLSIYHRIFGAWFVIFQIVVVLMILGIFLILVSFLIMGFVNNVAQMWLVFQKPPIIHLDSKGIAFDDSLYRWDQISGYTTIDCTIIINFSDYEVQGIVKIPTHAYILVGSNTADSDLVSTIEKYIDSSLYRQ